MIILVLVEVTHHYPPLSSENSVQESELSITVAILHLSLISSLLHQACPTFHLRASHLLTAVSIWSLAQNWSVLSLFDNELL